MYTTSTYYLHGIYSNLFHLSFFSIGSCNVNQECIPIKECPYTRKLFAQVKATDDAEEKGKLISAIRLRVCGSSTDRTVCCDLYDGGE